MTYLTLNHKLNTLLCLFLLSMTVQTALAQRDIPERPREQTSVYDRANMLSAQDEQRLERKLINYSDTTSTQIVIVTINSLQGEYIGTFAAKWAHQWGIGQSKKDNGVLLMVAKKEHKIWITTGYGLEPYLTDARTSLIYSKIIRPAFRAGNFYKGLDQGTTAIMQILAGKFQGNPNMHKSKQGFPIRLLLPAFFFIIIIIVMM